MTEGEDKPLKYPTIFNSADVAVITKIDLAAAVEFDWESRIGEHSSRPSQACRSFAFQRRPAKDWTNGSDSCRTGS